MFLEGSEGHFMLRPAGFWALKSSKSVKRIDDVKIAICSSIVVPSLGQYQGFICIERFE